MSETLFIIPARGGSKGVPGKNVKILAGKHLIYYTIDVARSFANDDLICVSSDDAEIISVVENYGLKVPFVRPQELATDTSSTYDVIMHALNFYNKTYKIQKVVLLQPTSPFRLIEHVKQALNSFTLSYDAVYGVKLAHGNPYQLLYKCSSDGFLEKIIEAPWYERRQDLPSVFEINGALYIYNAESLKQRKPNEFSRVKPYLMPEINSIDIDTMLDWQWCEYLIEKSIIKLSNFKTLKK